MTCTENFLSGSSCYTTCNACHDLVGSPSRVCRENGLWTGDAAYCQRMQSYIHNNIYLLQLASRRESDYTWGKQWDREIKEIMNPLYNLLRKRALGAIIYGDK